MVIGLTGLPTVGKDTFFNFFSKWSLEKKQQEIKRISFADALKKQVHSFIKEYYNIDVFNPTPEEKEIIRPLLIAHGYGMRQIQNDYWIEQTVPLIEEALNLNQIPVFTDVRYINEIKLIKSYNGVIINLKRNKETDFPKPDSDELIQVCEQANFSINITHLPKHEIEKQYTKIHENYFNELMNLQEISTVIHM